MTKTENFDLNQWEPADQVRRTDFNADNSKIDAALAAVNARADALASQTELNEVRALATKSRFTKLWETTTTAASTEITIPLTGVDWSKWDKVHLDMRPTNGQQMNMYFNEVDIYAAKFGVMGTSGHLAPRITFLVGNSADRYVCASRAGVTVDMSGTFSDLKRIIISSNGATITMPKGAQFILWGET